MIHTDDVKKAPEDTIWPISLVNNQLLCVVLRDRVMPVTHPRPVPTSTSHMLVNIYIFIIFHCVYVVFNLEMPLLKGTGISALSQQFARNQVRYQHKAFFNPFNIRSGVDTFMDHSSILPKYLAEVDEALIRIMDESLRADDVPRATSCAMRLSLVKSIEIAIKVADRFSETELAQYLEELKEAKLEEAMDTGVPSFAAPIAPM